jgi:hypothetical protein
MNAIQSLSSLSQETIQLFNTATATANGKPGSPMLNKNVTQALGLTWYDLQAPAKNLFPVITPLRNKIPRVMGNGDTATRWKAVTGINIANLRAGVPEGTRNGFVQTQVVNKLQSYKTLGQEDFVTFEAINAAKNFEDIRSTTVQRQMWSVMIAEEQVIVGGNSDTGVALGVTPTPTVTNSGTGGTIAAGTYSVIAVALTHQGWITSSVASGVPGVQTVTQPNGSTFTYNPGTGTKSASSTTTTSGATSTISASVTYVPGATAYAWYAGPAGSERLQVISTFNSTALTTLSGTNQLISTSFTADYSQNQYEFDGLLTQAYIPGSGATILTQPVGTPGTGSQLTGSSGDASVDQFEFVLKSMWDNKRLSPTVVYLNSQEIATVTKLAIKNNGAPIIRLNGDFSGGANGVTAGSVVGSYLNRYAMSGGQLLSLQLHPFVPPGTVIFHADTIPYPLSGVSNVAEIHLRQDYYSIDWPITQRRYETGVYTDECLAHYFPGAIGVINNIAP